MHHPMQAANPFIAKVWSFEKDIKELFPDLKKEKFDFIIDLHHNLRSSLVKRKLGVKSYSFNKINIEKWLMVNLKINRMPDLHIVDRYLATTEALGIKNDGQGLDFFIPDEDQVNLEDLSSKSLLNLSDGFVGLVLGAAHATKRLETSQLAALCQKIPYPVVLLGGPSDEAAAQSILKLELPNVINACGRYTILQSASIVAQARVIITHDTGLMHIAAAFQKPIISIWGNTIPGFGMYPYLQNSVEKTNMMEVNGLSCRPCSKIGHSSCPKKHFKCMRNQNLEAIVEKLNQMWAKGLK